jgi:hypothetical protein
MDETIDRDVYEGAGPDDIDVRLYEDLTRPEVAKLPSVTTILKTRDDDKSNLYDWQDRNDGEGNNAYHEHLFWYSRHVGTLGHWHALKALDPNLEWSDDEEQSRRELFGQNEDEVFEDPAREVLYSVLRGDRDKAGGTVSSWGEFYDLHPPYLKGDYYREALVERAQADIEFFKDAQLRLWSKLGVTRESVIAVEQFLFNDDYGYAGQVDLVYEDPAGYTVVADLKSSSGCYDKHQIQGAAYAKSVETAGIVDEVDRLEVHRAHPRTGQMAAHTHRDAPGKNTVHTTKYWNDGIETLWGDFHRLIQNFDDFDWSELEG